MSLEDLALFHVSGKLSSKLAGQYTWRLFRSFDNPSSEWAAPSEWYRTYTMNNFLIFLIRRLIGYFTFDLQYAVPLMTVGNPPPPSPPPKPR